MSSNCYFPILKTTISEMRALKKADFTESDVMHPIFELTKARKSKYDDIGDVYKRVTEIKDTLGSTYFYLDLTSEESLSNNQIESYFDDHNYFENWRNFITSLIGDELNVRPIIQAFDDSTLEELKEQMSFFSTLCGSFAIRLKPEYLDMGIALKLIQAAQDYEFTTILDAEFINLDNFDSSLKSLSNFLNQCHRDQLTFKHVILCSSSFPAMIDHKNKECGSFDIYEKKFFSEFKNVHPKLNIEYGDYASVHPFRNDITAYNWVPRIDFPLEDKIIFCRKQRNAGGYKNCAQRMTLMPEYIKNKTQCWGVQEILDAKAEPNGKSPSYWISVRINIHTTKVINWLRQSNSITSQG